MANRHRGEIEFEANGQTYKMRFGTWAIAELEGKLGRKCGQIFAALEDEKEFNIKTVIACIWAALQEHHEGTTMKEAAAIIDDLGVIRTGNLIQETLEIAFPDLMDAEVAESGTDNPTGNRAERRRKKAVKKGS